MAEYGLLVDYEWCTGCHSCEMACAVEHGFPQGQCGVAVCEVGPWSYGPENDRWQVGYQPAFTDQCDLCAGRVAKGHEPTCVKHCQAQVLKYGDLEDLAKELARKPKQTLFSCEAEN